MRASRWRQLGIVAVLCAACAIAATALAVSGGGSSDRAATPDGRGGEGWRLLPEIRGAAGLSELHGVRIGRRVVVVAGSSQRAQRVEALAYDLRRGEWRWAPRAPLRWRAGMSVIAAPGRHGYAIAWGGVGNGVPAFLADGARYDPGLGPRGGRRLGAWKRIAPAPIARRAFHSAVWTGSRMIVWGGAAGRRRLLGDGASYDPAHDRWTPIARAPLRSRSGHVAVWTGSRMVVWGGEVAKRRPGEEPLADDGASYDPRRDRWTPIARAPVRWTPGVQAAWTGEQLVVWEGRTVAAYRPATNRWEPNRWVRWPEPPAGIRRRGAAAAWTGEELLVWGGPPAGCRAECAPRDDRGRAVRPVDGAALDPRSGSWRTLPPAPLASRDRHVVVGLGGGRAFVWGGCCAESRLRRADGAVYTPPPLRRPDVGRELDAACESIDAAARVLCPDWLPAPRTRDGAPAFHVSKVDFDGGRCAYLTELHARRVDDFDVHPHHVWFGGTCRSLPLRGSAGRWPPQPGRDGHLALVGASPERPGGQGRTRPVRPRVVARTSVRGRRALVLAVEPFTRGGGVHGGHYAVVWNDSGGGYVVSLHFARGDRRLQPTAAQLRALLRAATSMRPAGEPGS